MIFLKGLALGLLIAIPVGPIGVLCIKRTLERGKLAGFISGLGAATADGLYGAVVAFGLFVISNFLMNEKFTLGLIGAALLIYTGIQSFNKKPDNIEISTEESNTLLKDYFSTFFLTVTNPSTIIFFTAFFASIGFRWRGGNTWQAIVLIAGVFIGSALWWLALSLSIDFIKSKMKNFSLIIINKVSGIIILLFAIMVLFDLFK